MISGLLMVDTSVVVALLRKGDGSKLPSQLFKMFPPGRIRLSAMTMGELRFGLFLRLARTQRGYLDRLEQIFGCAPIDADVAALYGEIAHKMHRIGTSIGMADTWIAAHAKSLNCTVVTLNQKDFARVPELKVVTPAQALAA